MVLGTLLEHRLHPIHSYGDTSCYLVLAISARRAREAMLSLNAWGLGSEGAVRIYEVVPKSVEKLGVWAHPLMAPTRLRVIWP